MPNTNGLVKMTDCNTKNSKMRKKTLSVTRLVTTAAFNAKATEIENNIPDTTDFTTAHEYNRLTKINFDARMKGEESL